MRFAIGSVAHRCLLSGVKQTSHFKGVRTVFDPNRDDQRLDRLTSIISASFPTHQQVDGCEHNDGDDDG
jgi:hypothetical protein